MAINSEDDVIIFKIVKGLGNEASYVTVSDCFDVLSFVWLLI